MQPGWRCGLSLSGGARASQLSAGGAWTIALVQGEGSSDLTQSCMRLWFIVNWAFLLGDILCQACCSSSSAIPDEGCNASPVPREE